MKKTAVFARLYEQNVYNSVATLKKTFFAV